MREASVLQEDGADGFRGRGKRYFEPLEDVWWPSDDDNIEDEEGVEDDEEGERAVESEWLRLVAEEVDGREEDGGSENEERVHRWADHWHFRLH